MLSGVDGALAVTLLSMKNKNWKQTYFNALFAYLLLLGQISFFFAGLVRDFTDHDGPLSATYNQANIGLGTMVNDVTVYHPNFLAGPHFSFSSYPGIVKSAMQYWSDNFDPLISVVGFGILISWGMVYGLLSRHQELEHMLAEFKQKETEYRHALLDQKMILLRTQINPHFLSNSMSVIGAYVLEQTPIQAYQYLQDFSSLMRDILEKAAEPFLPLEDEVHFLSAFLRNLSLQLPENKLEWHFELDPKLDPKRVLVPTMILQPLVENAIEHGIKPKKGRGRITISFTEIEGLLVCAVEDDGVGRLSEQQIQRPGHSSMALAITQQRLQLMSAEHLSTYGLKIFDLVNDEGEAAGTKVQLKLPLLKVTDERF
ncbi:MAG: histidine kinase [Saprospiraceae bacterium]|nr:histidine kinase [Saprospiraceae bacterium]